MLIRKTFLLRETTETDASGKPCAPVVRVVALAVVQNPFAGEGFVEDLSPLFDIGAELGERLMAEAVSHLGKVPVTYGKGALVGVAGDMEHGAAMVLPSWARRCGQPLAAAGR